MRIRLILLFGLCTLLAGCTAYWASPPAGQGVTAVAYPPPVWTEEPTEPPLPTMTPWPTLPTTPTPTYPPGPPKPTPEVTPIRPFPTPAFPPAPEGPRPAALGTIWYPYLPSPDARPVLKAVLVDEEGRRWGELDQTIDLDLSIPGYPGSRSLDALYISPDGRSFVADIAYGEESRSFWVNPASGEFKPVSTDPEHGDFLAWGPAGQIFVGNGYSDIWLEDLGTRDHRVFIFPKTEFDYLAVDALSTSPDGVLLADACVYPATVSNPESNIEIGLQSLKEQGERAVVASWNIPGWVSVGWLGWSPDGQRLALNAVTGTYGSPKTDWQLWLIRKDGGPPTLLAHEAYGTTWSPDGRYIAFVRRATYEKPAPADLWLFDLATSTEIQLTRFDEQRYVTSVAWSPDGQRLAFAVTVEIGDSTAGYDKIGDYGEVWITSLDGQEQYPIAGPTAPDAPVAWLPAMKGGQ